MIAPISITAFASMSALGSTPDTIWKAYLDDKHRISTKQINDIATFMATIADKDEQLLSAIKIADNKYKNLDKTVVFAIFSARKAIQHAGWKSTDNFGINFGSSRGATTLFEKYHKEFLETKKSSTLSSPTTTLGNISSWVAHDLQTQGPEVSHSITCSTALHSLLNGVAWINSGMCTQFLVGGSEAPLTNFTIAQMQALKVYAKHDTAIPNLEQVRSTVTEQHNSATTKRTQGMAAERSRSEDITNQYPCKAFDLNKTKNTMVLGEGTAAVCLEKGITKNAIATIEGIGYATEVLKHNTSVTANAECFQKSMKMATAGIHLSEVDVIVMHAPGTIKGDSSEVNAIKKVFGNDTPFLTTNKWKIGHTFGSSGLLSLELGLLMLQHQKVIEVPFAVTQTHPKKIKKILVNAVGFGGNAVSVLIAKP